ncbi:MAG: leucine-rich repeat domain-containing protein [Flavobacteriales bacterium TMED96]|nr:MAG: leucine-rich repeat domain-containing protein [Flavobacteriales bacterium TMED96]
MKKLLPLLLLILFSCSKNDEEAKVRFSLIIDASEGGYVSSTGGDYEEGSLVSVSAFANDGYVFVGWTGSSTSTFSEVEITMNSGKYLTAVFEKQLFNLVDENNIFIGVGKWKIRRPKGVNRESSGKFINCEIYEIIFRSNSSFTFTRGDSKVTGQYSLDSEGNINLVKSNIPYGTMRDVVLTDNYISFSTEFIDNCNLDLDADRVKDYDPISDPEAVTYIPDDNFEQSIIDAGFDEELDNYVLTRNISGIIRLGTSESEIKLFNKGIKNLIGLDEFRSLKEFSADLNLIDSVDFSKNLNLETISIYYNNIKSIDISKNENLKSLNILGNPIQTRTIDISKNLNLEVLSIGGSAGTRLINNQGEFIAQIPQITAKISSLDFSLNSKLTNLKITHSEIIGLETTNYNNLDKIMLLDLSFNQLQSLDVSGFTILESLNIIGNSNLDCVVVSQNQLSNIPTTWIKDSIAEYNIDCK